MNPGRILENPHLTERQLVGIVEADYLIDVVCTGAPYRKDAVWYGEWVIQVPEQRGESERFLVAARNGDGPRLRVFKTGYGLISLMEKLGFRHIALPMEKGGSASHRIGQDPVPHDKPVTATPIDLNALSLNAVKSGLLQLARHGFVSVASAGQLVEAGYAMPVELEVKRDGEWSFMVDTILLTDAGRMTASIVAEREGSSGFTSDPVPDWARAITEDYIRQQADTGTHIANIGCAKAWYAGQKTPERRTIMQPPVQFQLRSRRKQPA